MPLLPPHGLLVDLPTIDEVLDLETGEILSARHIVGDDMEKLLQLRMKLKQGNLQKLPIYACPLCVVPVHLVSMEKKRRFYFRHETEDGRCPLKTKGSLSGERILAMKYDGARESMAHIQMKEIIAASLRCDPDFSDVQIEPTWKGAEANSRRRPDVRAVWRGSLPVAFEVQLSTTFLQVIAERRSFYLKEGGLLFWVFKSFNVGHAKLTQDDIFYNNNRNAFAASDATLDASRREGRLILDCIWSEPSLDQGQLLWSQHRRPAAFSEFTVEQESQRVYLFDADGAKSKCVANSGDDSLREDFHRYWLRESAIYDEQAWQSLCERFKTKGIDFPRYPGEQPGFRAFMDTLFSAREGRPVGWRYANIVHVAHHVFDQYKDQLWAFKLMLKAHERADQIRADDTSQSWRKKKVPAYRKAWAVKNPAFEPNRKFDGLIAFLFPEIAIDLKSAPR
jgi:Family of unknown function (DUF6035)